MAQKFPYTPTAGALLQFIHQLRKSFPPVVDAAMLKKLGLASNNESYIINVVRFLGLIDDQGNRNPNYQGLFAIADDAKFAEGFSELVHTSYGELYKLHGEGAWTLDKPALSTFFRQSDGTSAIVGERQVSTFVTLAELSGKRAAASISRPANGSDSKRKTIPASKKISQAEKAKAGKGFSDSEISKLNVSREVGVSVKIEVILPADASAETYENIFRSIRKNLIE